MDEPPEEVLGIPRGAKPEEVRKAYQKKALTLHPDKGGDPSSFCRLQRAYHALTSAAVAADDEAAGRLQLLSLPPIVAARDFELREHRNVVESWFQQHGEDLRQHIAKQEQALVILGLQACDVGSMNHNEEGQEMRNQCFYLSLARSYLGATHKRAVLEETALHFKRVVETAVLASHPDWGGNRVGEDVQAFSDFLFFVLGSHGFMSELCVVVFDSVSSGVEIYKGKHFPEPEREAEQRANLLVVRYLPGHYQALVPPEGRTGWPSLRPTKAGMEKCPGPTLAELQKCLDDCGVLYVVTDG